MSEKTALILTKLEQTAIRTINGTRQACYCDPNLHALKFLEDSGYRFLLQPETKQGIFDGPFYWGTPSGDAYWCFEGQISRTLDQQIEDANSHCYGRSPKRSLIWNNS